MKHRLPLTIVVSLIAILVSSGVLFLCSWPGPRLSITRGLKPVRESAVDSEAKIAGEIVPVRSQSAIYRVDMPESEVVAVVDKELPHLKKSAWVEGGWLYTGFGEKREHVLIKARGDGLPGTEISIGYGFPISLGDRLRLKAMLIGT